MKDFNLYTVLRDLLRNAVFILLFAVSCAVAAYSLCRLFYVPEYKCSSTLIVRARSNANFSSANLTVTSEAADVFDEILKSDILAEKLEEKLGTDFTGVVFSSSRIQNTNLIVLNASSSVPFKAFDALSAVLDNYSDVTKYAFGDMLLDIMDPPSTPVSPSNNVDETGIMHLAAFLGLLAASTVAVLLSFFRDTLKNSENVEHKLDVKVLATVRHENVNKTLISMLRKVNKSALITNPVVGFSFTETINALTSKLEYIASENDRRCIMFTSYGVNEGKSTIASNVALALALSGKKTVLIDCDLRNPSQFRIFDKKRQTKNDLAKLLGGYRKFEDVAVPGDTEGLTLLMNYTGTASTELIDSASMSELIAFCKSKYDFVIIDTPPVSLLSDAEILAGKADASVLVVQQDRYLVPDIIGAAEILERADSVLLGCVFNNVRGFSPVRGYGYNSYGGYGDYGKPDRSNRSVSSEGGNGNG